MRHSCSVAVLYISCHILKVVNALAVYTTEYDNAGDPIRVIAPDTGITRFVYDGNKNLIQLTDSLGRTKNWTYDERERVTSYTDALGNQTLMAYDEVGNLIAYTREDGTVIEYVYGHKSIARPLKNPSTVWSASR